DLADLDAVFRGPDGHLDEHQLAADVGGARVVDERDDVDELLELLGDLLDGGVLPRDDERRAREAGAFGLGDRERLDVVAPPGEEAGHAKQDARLVADRDGEDVTGDRHAGTAVTGSGSASDSGSWSPMIISSTPAPAGTMGQTFSAS